MANNTNLKPFKEGYDPRRNIKGVPKDAVLFRKHVRKIAAEIVGGDDSGMTRLDAALRLAMSSKNPAHLKIIIQTLYPEVLRDNVDVTSGGAKLQVIAYEYNDSITALAPRPVGDSDASSED